MATGNISPTPWQMDWKTEGLAILDANEHRIASLSFTGKPISTKVTAEEQDANLRLMLIAPELLAFVRLIAGELLDGEEMDPTEGDGEYLLENDYAVGCYGTWVEEARDLARKAVGPNPS